MEIPPDLDNAPRVMLGGRAWCVPLLAARQNRIIDPLILQLLPLFARWQSDKAAALGELGPKEYDALQEIAFHGIKRAHPELTREQFLDLPVTLPELVAAMNVIAQQTGIFQRGEASAGEEAAGNARTGTASSPMSAI